MKCWKCCNDLPAGVAFCKYCGAQMAPPGRLVPPVPQAKTKSGSKLKISLLTTIPAFL